jgi:hypothetical protein
MDDVVDEYVLNGQGIDCFLGGWPLSSLRHVVDKCDDAVVAISRDRQVSDEVTATSLPMAFGYWKWLYESHEFPTPFII